MVFRVPKSCCPQAPHWTSAFIFITLEFLSFLASQTVVQTKGPFITAFLTAGHYLIKTSGSRIVCWRLFKVLNGRRRNGGTYNPWGVGLRRPKVGSAQGRLSDPLLWSGISQSPDFHHWSLWGEKAGMMSVPQGICLGRGGEMFGEPAAPNCTEYSFFQISHPYFSE